MLLARALVLDQAPEVIAGARSHAVLLPRSSRTICNVHCRFRTWYRKGDILVSSLRFPLPPTTEMRPARALSSLQVVVLRRHSSRGPEFGFPATLNRTRHKTCHLLVRDRNCRTQSLVLCRSWHCCCCSRPSRRLPLPPARGVLVHTVVHHCIRAQPQLLLLAMHATGYSREHCCS